MTIDEKVFESFKRVTLDEAWAGMWLQEPFRDSTNWFPELDEEARRRLSERALRELAAEDLIFLRHTRTGTTISAEQFDSVFASARRRSSATDPLYDDVEYRQTEKGAKLTQQ